MSSDSADKDTLHRAVIAAVEANAAAIVASQKATMAGATHAEAKQEGSKDTRAIEAGYLARGLAERAEQIQAGLSRLRAFRVQNFTNDDVVTLGAAVDLEEESGSTRRLYLLPEGGGLSVEIDGATVQVVTPKAPLGAALMGKETGDTVTFATPRGARQYEIIAIF